MGTLSWTSIISPASSVSGGVADLLACATIRDTRTISEQLFSEFSPEIDPCGENGEFHTFVYAGPMFQNDLSVEVGEIVSRDGFVFADLSLSQEKVNTPSAGS